MSNPGVNKVHIKIKNVLKSKKLKMLKTLNENVECKFV